MSDLGKTQSEWNRFLGREVGGLILAPIRDLREMRDKFTRERTQIVSLGDINANVGAGGITLSGVDYGVNTSTEGRLYVRITGSGPYTVSLYTAAGASGLVAQGSAAADATATLAEQNSSGLTGTFDLAASVTADITDDHQLLVFVDYLARLPKVLTQDGTVEDDAYTRRDLQAAFAEVAAKMGEAEEAMKRAAALVLLSSRGNPVARGNAFLGTNYNRLGEEVFSEDTDGNRTRSNVGLFYFLADAMADETTAGEQDVAKRTVAAGAGSFEADNDGSGAVASHTPTEAALAGTWVFECNRDTIGAERFRYLFTSTDGKVTERGENGPVIGQQWSGPRGFGPITITRTLSKTNDGSNNVFAAASGCTVVGETSANTNDGDLYAKVEANGSNWNISFYKAASLHASQLVAKATNIAASAAFEATPQNQSGLTVNWTLGGTVSAVSNIVLSLNPFKVQNAQNKADKFTVAVTVSSGPGLFQELMAKVFGVALNSDTSGSESISDDYVKAGTFVPFVTQDN